MCLESEPGAAGWETQTNPLSHGGPQEINRLNAKER